MQEERTKDIVSELGELETQALELLLGLGAEGVASHGPEVGNGRADGGVSRRGELVYVSGVGNLALRCG